MNAPKTIDITPTWSALVDPMLAAYAHNKYLQSEETLTDDGARALEGLLTEFRQMAKAADLWNEIVSEKLEDRR